MANNGFSKFIKNEVITRPEAIGKTIIADDEGLATEPIKGFKYSRYKNIERLNRSFFNIDRY